MLVWIPTVFPLMFRMDDASDFQLFSAPDVYCVDEPGGRASNR